LQGDALSQRLRCCSLTRHFFRNRGLINREYHPTPIGADFPLENSPVIGALLALFLVIAAGHLARRFLLKDPAIWSGGEKISYYILVPALLIEGLAKTKLSSVPVGSIAGALLTANLSMAMLLMALRAPMAQRFSIDGPAYTSIFQGAMRWNAFVALAMAGAFYGETGVTLASVVMAVLIPVLNVQSVWILRRYGSGQSGSLWQGLATNPFIIGIVGGLAVNLSGLALPLPVMTGLKVIGDGALGMGLLLVGAGLQLGDLRRPQAALTIGVVLRLVLLPLVGGLAGIALGLTGTALAVVVICLAVPTASASYLLARQMGGDAPLMAAIITAQTILSFATMPALFLLFRL
jgi:malonate transporter and related proteins